MTRGSAWFSREQNVKGTIEPGKYADLAVLSEDYFSVPEENIKNITLVMTVLGGKIVYANSEFKQYSPPELPASPDWSPVKKFGGYYHADYHRSAHMLASAAAATNKPINAGIHSSGHGRPHTVLSENGKWNMHCPGSVG